MSIYETATEIKKINILNLGWSSVNSLRVTDQNAKGVATIPTLPYTNVTVITPSLEYNTL